MDSELVAFQTPQNVIFQIDLPTYPQKRFKKLHGGTMQAEKLLFDDFVCPSKAARF